jgi:ribokinase
VTTNRGVVVVGSLNRDYVFSVDRLPGPGETLLGQDLVLWCGGKGANQTVAAALIGAGHDVPVAIVGAVGGDDDGGALVEGLREAGVDAADVVVRPDVRSGAALITVAADGENTIVVAPGANRTLGPDEVAAALARRRPAVVVVQCEIAPDVVVRTVGAAAALGARPVLNLSPVPGPGHPALEESVLALCDPLVVNESEAGALLGRTVSAGGAEAAARDLAARVRSVVVTAGASGAYVVADGEARHVPATPATVVDTTGAGDAFTGALAVALALGHDLVTATTGGARVAAYSVARPGAQASFPTWRDVDIGESSQTP